MIEIINNKYDGVTLNSTTLPQNNDEFQKEIEQLIASIENKKLLWIKIPIENSEFIPILTKLDFEFHHCDEKNLMLVRKMTPNAYVPSTKNYIVGVGAFVMNKGKVLVIRDRFSIGFKLPGGHIDKNESIKDALKREVYEETGVNIEFESIVNIGHFRNGQFGESNLYMVCTAKAISEKITILDTDEIAEAKWIDPEELLKSADTNNYNKSVVNAALNNIELKLTEHKIELRVPNAEVFF